MTEFTKDQMKELADIAINRINKYRKNKDLMRFVNEEAYNELAREIAGVYNDECSPERAMVLAAEHENIKSRFESYVNSGLIGMYLVSIEESVDTLEGEG